MPSYVGHVVTENRNGLVVEAMVTQASKTAEAEAALAMLGRLKRGTHCTLGADGSYLAGAVCSAAARPQGAAQHVAEYAPNPKWPNWLSQEERNEAGYAIRQRKRKLVEKVFGWAKQDRAARQVKLRGRDRVDWLFRLLVTAHNLVRMQKLIPAG